MQIVEVIVDFPDGMTISDRATYIWDLDQVYLSARLASVLREFSTSESPPLVTAVIDDNSVTLHQRTDRCFEVGRVPEEAEPRSSGLMFGLFGHAWTKDQRQQFGRFAHTLSAASVVGAVGYWHSTTVWTLAAVGNIAMLVILVVLLFSVGMASMNGD